MPDETREPGAPIGSDEIDPDLVKLRRPAPQIGLWSALGVAILCVALLVRLRHDFAYARQGGDARTVSAAAIVAGEVATNSYVAVAAPHDRASAIRMFVTKGSSGWRLVSARGTSDRLWLALPGDAWNRAVDAGGVVTGRLRRLDEVRYHGPLAAALARHPTPRFVTGDALRAAKAGGATQLTLIDGTTLAIAATDEVDLDLIDPGAAVVVATISTAYPSADAWAQALTTAGVLTAGQAPLAATKDIVRWLVKRPDAVASITASLDAATLWGARAEVSRVNVRTSWSTLDASDAGVRAHDAVIPWSAIDVAAVWAPRPLPSSAWVVIADDAPGDYWYLWPIYLGLALLGALATWALVRGVRGLVRERAATVR